MTVIVNSVVHLTIWRKILFREIWTPNLMTQLMENIETSWRNHGVWVEEMKGEVKIKWTKKNVHHKTENGTLKLLLSLLKNYEWNKTAVVRHFKIKLFQKVHTFRFLLIPMRDGFCASSFAKFFVYSKF